MATLGERIKEERLSHKMTQTDLGNICGVTKYTISLYESNKSTPNDEIKKIMSDYFGISLDYLLGYTDIRNYTDTVFDSPGKLIENNDVKSKNLTKKDIEVITKNLNKFKENLRNGDMGASAFGGEITEEDLEKLEEAMFDVYSDLRVINKERYTPKKYKKTK